MARKILTGKNPNNEPPQWAIIAVVASIALLIIVSMLPESWLASLPFGTSDYFYIGLIALPVVVMICAMLAHKLLQARAASTWLQAQGQITKSTTEARSHQFAGETSEVKNFPAIAYRFSVDGKTYTGTRISIGDDTAGANLEVTLKRYPRDAAVTVFYDPKNPKNCVLERELPKQMVTGCAGLIAIVVIPIGTLIWLATSGTKALGNFINPSQAPVVMFALLFGLVMLLAFFATWRNARKANSWPIAKGKIITSTTESFREKNDRGPTHTLYAPLVQYRYVVNGISYHGKQITLATTSAGGSLAAAEKTAARYPVGREVDVHYDPSNTENAALENTGAAAFLLLAGAAFCFLVAAYAAGVF